MTHVVPLDQPDRDRIQYDLSETLFVEAGAGTGKTHSLVLRIVRLIASGAASAESIAAITFTERAAVELQDRVRQELEDAVRKNEMPPIELNRCRAALAGLDAAAISTLHGFAQRILTAYPLEAGLPPVPVVQDEVRSSIAFQDRWSEWTDSFFSDVANEDLVTRAVLLGVEVKHLKDLAKQFHQHWDRLENAAFPADLPPLPMASDVDGVTGPLRDACAVREQCRDSTDGLYLHLCRVAKYLERLQAAESGVDRLRLLAEITSISTTKGNAERWPPSAPSRTIKSQLKQSQAARAAIIDGMKGPVLFALMAALRAFILAWAQERRREGQLQFHDLLVLARNLLRDHAGVRAALRAQYTHLLLDEFQDTDPIQAEIAVLLGSEDSASGSWLDAGVGPGRLFFVGDPKQSIYRFRRADIELYMDIQQRFAEGCVQLSQNFRSVRGILVWANHVFTTLMQSDNLRGQPAYAPLNPTREGADCPVWVVGGPDDGNADDVRNWEADDLARVVRTARATGWDVLDPDSKRIRPVRYADMAILIPTRTSLPGLEVALERAGIPYRIESRSLLFAANEVRDLLNTLAAIDDPTDEVALIAALRSPIYACDDVAMLGFKQARGRWDYRSTVPAVLATDHPVRQAFSSLLTLHQDRAWQGISGIVDRLVRERRLFELAFAHGRPRDVWNRLRFIVDQARAFQESGGSTLRQFVEWAERQAEEGAAIQEQVEPERDDDAVRIMTVHAAKGLEFPVVLLAGLGSQGGVTPSVRALWRSFSQDGQADAVGEIAEARLGSKEKGFSTLGFGAREQREGEMDRHERVRLLYVGATRARDHLVVSLHHNKRGTKSHADRLWVLCEAAPDLWQRFPSGSMDAVAVTPAAFDDSPERRAAWLARRTAMLTARERGRAIAATAIARAAAPLSGGEFEKNEPEAETPPWKRGRAGTNFGRAVHSVLQSIDLATGDGLPAIARAQAAAEGVAARAGEVEGAVRAALAAASVREAVAGGRYWREVYVSTGLGNLTVEGFIDLLYETARGFVVVDYKTDTLFAGTDLEEATERYRLQGGAYALALQQSLGRPVVRCVFVFTSAGREYAVRDLPAAIEEVRRVAASL